MICFTFPGRKHFGLALKAVLSWSVPGSSKVRDCAWWCLMLYCLRAAKDLRAASCWSQEPVLSLLCALPLLSTVNGSKAVQSVWKQHREEEMQYLALLPKCCWLGPGTVWELCGRCGGGRANVLHPHGQHWGTAAGLWFYGSPCILHHWQESCHKERVCSSWEMELRAALGVTWSSFQKSQHLPVWQRRKEML